MGVATRRGVTASATLPFGSIGGKSQAVVDFCKCMHVVEMCKNANCCQSQCGDKDSMACTNGATIPGIQVYRCRSATTVAGIVVGCWL